MYSIRDRIFEYLPLFCYFPFPWVQSLFHAKHKTEFSINFVSRPRMTLNLITYVYLFEEYARTVKLIPTMHRIFMRKVFTF